MDHCSGKPYLIQVLFSSANPTLLHVRPANAAASRASSSRLKLIITKSYHIIFNLNNEVEFQSQAGQRYTTMGFCILVHIHVLHYDMICRENSESIQIVGASIQPWNQCRNVEFVQ